MRWGSPDLLVLFLIVPVIALFLRARWQARIAAMETFGNKHLVDRLSQSIDRSKQIAKQTLIVVAIVILIVAMLGPQFGERTRKLERTGQDIIIALDLSASMLAEDFVPNRLSKAKQEIKSLMSIMDGDRIGLVVFAGEAQVLCPLTLDYGAAALFLDEVDTNWLPTPGTDLSEALRVGGGCFVAEEQKYKNLILITDGESHEGDPIALAGELADQGITVYAIGIGKQGGVPIPIVDSTGGKSYKRDRQGDIIATKLDIDTLQQVAAKTGGRWYEATGGQLELNEIYDEIQDQESKELHSSVTTIYEERFQIPLLICLLILALEPCLSDRRRKKDLAILEEENRAA